MDDNNTNHTMPTTGGADNSIPPEHRNPHSDFTSGYGKNKAGVIAKVSNGKYKPHTGAKEKAKYAGRTHLGFTK